MIKNTNSGNKANSKAKAKNKRSKDSGTIITISITKTFILGSDTIPKEYESLIFRKIENLLKSFTIPSWWAKTVIEPIKVSMSKESKNADFLGYLAATEKASCNFELDKIFSYIPTQEKYRFIGSIFERLNLKDAGLDCIPRQEFIVPINYQSDRNN